MKQIHEEKMKEYMLIYQGGDPEWMKNASPEDMQEKMSHWTNWMAELQAKDRLVTGGSPLHYSGKRIDVEGVVTDIAASEFKELVSGYSIIKAVDEEEALELTKTCPIFQSPNIIVELREVVQMG